MSAVTSIEWTDRTWNPASGCTKVSPGCDFCYAERIVDRFGGRGAFATVVRREETLWAPLRWRNPQKVFVNSMSDLFHADIPDSFIVQVFSVMARTPALTYQLLTKRHGRMRSLLGSDRFRQAVLALAPHAAWPLQNLWLGVSVEDQKHADLRIPALLDTPAWVRWLSCEPLLGPIDLPTVSPAVLAAGGVDWLVLGGESGPQARPMHPGWARSLRDQCAAAEVPFFFKQWGEYRPVPVVDAPGFAGGRAYDHPRGGRAAAACREPGRGGRLRPMRPGDRARGVVMLDVDTIAVRLGKKQAGRELDGRRWEQFPPGPRHLSRSQPAAEVVTGS